MSGPEIEVIQLGDDLTVVPIDVSPLPGSAVQIPRGYGATKLDELSDVAGATAGFTGQALVKQSNGQWSPATVQGGGGGGVTGPLSYLFEQVEPSTVWIAAHPLPFIPAAMQVEDHVGDRHFPRVSIPTSNTIQLDFDTPVRGTVRLS